MDITQGPRQLSNVKEVHVVAVNNEVKELLWIMIKGYKEDTTIRTVNILDLKNGIMIINTGRDALIPNLI